MDNPGKDNFQDEPSPEEKFTDEKLRDEVEEAVKSGEDIRASVRSAVESAAARADRAAGRLTKLSRTALDTALDAIERSAPDDPESALRQVVDGIGDGLERTAHATRLAVEEAAGEGRAFAREDLQRTSDDFRAIARMFVDTIDHAINGASEQTRKQVSGARDHASRTINAIRPSLESAADAAASDPIGLIGESATAATRLSREAAGSLLGVVGNLLKGAGDRLSPPGEDSSRARPPR